MCNHCCIPLHASYFLYLNTRNRNNATQMKHSAPPNGIDLCGIRLELIFRRYAVLLLAGCTAVWLVLHAAARLY